ncbi:hypothetical protein GGF45_005767, partial [Coemansia sp. RSA 551]
QDGLAATSSKSPVKHLTIKATKYMTLLATGHPSLWHVLSTPLALPPRRPRPLSAHHTWMT